MQNKLINVIASDTLHPSQKTDVARAPAAEHFNLNHLIEGLNPATGTVKEKIAITE